METEYQKAVRWILQGIIEDDATWILDGIEKLKDLVKSEPVTEADQNFAKELLSQLIEEE